MLDVSTTILDIFSVGSINEKFSMFDSLKDRIEMISSSENLSSIDFDKFSKGFSQISILSELEAVEPQRVKARKNLQSNEGKAVMVHAIAHIEYSAFELALQTAFLGQGLGPGYLQDWFRVAGEEKRHFLLLQNHLENLGYSYGSFSVHLSLFEGAGRAGSLLERLAIVHRYQEANGLDANPALIRRLERHQPHDNGFIEKFIDTLEIILEDEIGHVALGDKWFRKLCPVGIDAEELYFDIITRVYPNRKQQGDRLNLSARQEAGFSVIELQRL